MVEVIAEFNHYMDREWVLGEEGLQKIAVSGVFRIGNVQGLTSALEALGLSVTRSIDGHLLIVSNTKRPQFDPMLL